MRSSDVLVTGKIKLKRSRKQELETSKRYGGKRQPGSGNQWHSPGDVKTSRFLISNKRTDAQSFRLTLKDWAQTISDGFEEDRHPAMEIEMSGEKLFVITEEHFELLQRTVEEIEHASS